MNKPLSVNNAARVMNVLHVVPSFYPATRWGGPIFSTKAICDWIALNRPVDLRVLTTDAAGPDRHDTLALASRQQVQPAGYVVTYYRRIFGHSGSIQLLAALPGAIRWADVVHVMPTYSFPVLPTLALARLIGRPVIWSPRGAIQATAEWPDAPRQRLKGLFERLGRALAPAGTVLHVTAPEEAAATGPRMPGMELATIPNSVEMPEGVVRLPVPGKTRLMFLSRVHEKKGLELLIEALAGLPAQFDLTIYGTGDPAYLEAIHQKIASAQLGDRVRFGGHVSGAAKSDAFAQADIFVLPSYSENFGIVVAEALAHGLPVITTDRTPWRALDEEGCGACIAPDATALRQAILALSQRDLAAMGARGRAWVGEQFSPARTHGAMYALYERVVAKHRKAASEKLELAA